MNSKALIRLRYKEEAVSFTQVRKGKKTERETEGFTIKLIS